MTMRVKLVIMIRIAGASDTTVISATACIAPETFSFLVRSGIENAGAAGVDGASVSVGAMGEIGAISSSLLCPRAIAPTASIAITVTEIGLLARPIMRPCIHARRSATVYI